MSNMLTSAKRRAVEGVIQTFSKSDFAADVAGDFTCDEAEAVYSLLLEFGHAAEANAWLNAHALADKNPSAAHYRRGEAVRRFATTHDVLNEVRK